MTGSIEQHRKELIDLQSGYNAKYPNAPMPISEAEQDVQYVLDRNMKLKQEIVSYFPV